MKKIWHISDSHSNHLELEIPEGVDTVIFSGDCSNARNLALNRVEVANFIDWFSKLPMKHKIFVAGNHDGSIEFGMITKEYFKERGITYLENESIYLEGYNIFGSPYTPTFGNWSFMKARNKIGRLWDLIPIDTDILITHGAPMSVLDLTITPERRLIMAGDSSLYKRTTKLPKLKLHLFGHIHNTSIIKTNSGMYSPSWKEDLVYSNGSCCTDGKMGDITSHGNIIPVEQ